MEYEFLKYCCDIKTLKIMLEIYGVAIIPNLLDNDECTGQYVMASVFHSHIINNYPDTTNKNSKNYQTLVKLFSDYYFQKPMKHRMVLQKLLFPKKFFSSTHHLC